MDEDASINQFPPPCERISMATWWRLNNISRAQMPDLSSYGVRQWYIFWLFTIVWFIRPSAFNQHLLPWPCSKSYRSHRFFDCWIIFQLSGRSETKGPSIRWMWNRILTLYEKNVGFFSRQFCWKRGTMTKCREFCRQNLLGTFTLRTLNKDVLA